MSDIKRSLSLRSALRTSALGVAVSGLAAMALAVPANAEDAAGLVLPTEHVIAVPHDSDGLFRSAVKGSVGAHLCGAPHGTEAYLDARGQHSVSTRELAEITDFSLVEVLIETRAAADAIYKDAIANGTTAALCSGAADSFFADLTMPRIPSDKTAAVAYMLTETAKNRGRARLATSVCSMSADHEASVSDWMDKTLLQEERFLGGRLDSSPSTGESLPDVLTAVWDAETSLKEFCATQAGYIARRAAFKDRPSPSPQESN